MNIGDWHWIWYEGGNYISSLNKNMKSRDWKSQKFESYVLIIEYSLRNRNKKMIFLVLESGNYFIL